VKKFREMMFSGGNKGFTLIELLVVIAVLGILAGIAVPRLGGVTDKARTSEASSALGSIKTSLELYSVEQVDNSYPDSQASFDTAMRQYIDNYSDNTSEYNGNLDWTVTYNGSGDTGFTVILSNGDLTATLTNTGEGTYENITTTN
jgi:prepilin-type N-terminal cleavage/methylation domain-containing protein